eukprot:5584770-Pyramimonas_sp.AAC.1
MCRTLWRNPAALAIPAELARRARRGLHACELESHITPLWFDQHVREGLRHGASDHTLGGQLPREVAQLAQED